MELKPGYKLTETSGLQTGWEDRKLGDFVALQRGHDLTATQRRRGSVPVMGAAGQNGFHDTAIVKAPGVVVGRSGASFGQAHFCDQDFWPHNTGLYVTDFRGNDPLFVFYFLRALDFTRYNSGGAQPSLNRNFIAPISIRVPTSAEQRAIAGALSDVDALIGALDQLLAKKRDLKQAAMQQLLTGHQRLPGFSGEWHERPLSSVIVGLDAGVSVNSIDDEQVEGSNEFAILKTSAVANGVFIPNECKRIAPRDLCRMKLNPRAESILISRMNTVDLVGECGYVNSDYPRLFVPDRLWMTRFRPDSQTSAKWLSYVLSSSTYRRLLKGIATGTSGSMKNISKGTFLSLKAFFPGPAEQTAIAEVLSDMDAELAALEQKRDKTRLLKQGMMQELLTGRTRLI